MSKRKVSAHTVKEKPFRTETFNILKDFKKGLAENATLKIEAEAVVKPTPPITVDENAIFWEAMAAVKPLAAATERTDQKNRVKNTLNNPETLENIQAVEDSELFLNEISRLKLDIKFSGNRLKTEQQTVKV